MRAYITFLFDTNFKVYSLVHKDLKSSGIFRLSVMVSELKAVTVYYF